MAALGRADRRQADASLRANRQLVSGLEITDLALWSSASYCRHLSQADRFAHRSQHPGAMDTLPSGSLAGPPPAWPPAEAR